MKRMFGIELQQLMTSKLLAMRANVSWERGGEGTNVGHDHNLVEPAGEREDICILLSFYFFLNILCHCIARIEGKAQQTVLISDLICVICDKVC